MLTRSEIFESKLTPLNFGTSGIRGQVIDMTDMECYINTRGFIKYLLNTGEIKENSKIVLGGDLRSSTPRIMSAVHKAIADENCETLYCGFLPTPTLSFYAWKRNFPGVVITGSHIPEDLNGIKFIKLNGEVLKTDEKDILENIATIRKEEYTKSEEASLFDMNGNFKAPSELPLISEEENAIEEFKKRYTDVFPSDVLKNKKIVVYEQSSIGRDILKDILFSLGAEVVPVERSEKFIPIDTEKIPDFVTTSLKKWAENYKPFAIVSMDGDADRPLLADEHGTFLPGDLLGLLVSLYLKPDFVALPVTSNDAAIIALEKLKIEISLTKVGSPYCIAAMNTKLSGNTNSKVVSWERNGGYLLGSTFTIYNKSLAPLPTRDSFLPIILALVFATEAKVPLSELIDKNLPHRFIIANAIDNKTEGCEKYSAIVGKEIIKSFSPNENENEARMRPKLEKYFSKELGYTSIDSIDYTDGIRISFSNGDVAHLRPSSNAPEFRLYATSDTEGRANKILEDRLIILPKIISDTL